MARAGSFTNDGHGDRLLDLQVVVRVLLDNVTNRLVRFDTSGFMQTDLFIGKFSEEIASLSAVLSNTTLHSTVALAECLLHAFAHRRGEGTVGFASLASFLCQALSGNYQHERWERKHTVSGISSSSSNEGVGEGCFETAPPRFLFKPGDELRVGGLPRPRFFTNFEDEAPPPPPQSSSSAGSSISGEDSILLTVRDGLARDLRSTTSSTVPSSRAYQKRSVLAMSFKTDLK